MPLPAGAGGAAACWVQGVPLPAVEGVSHRIGSPRRAGGCCFTRQERGVSPSPSGRRDGGQGFAVPVAIAAGRPGAPRGRGGLDPGSGRSLAAFSAVRPLGCLIRLDVSPWVKKMVGCVFFPPRYEAAAGIRTPSYDWLHILESLGHQCGGSESDKSQERTDLLSEGTGLIYRAGKL